MPSSHVRLSQSVATRHGAPSGQRSQLVSLPPQSTPDSSPLVKPSVQLGSTHSLETQTPLEQSRSSLQGEPVGQPGHSPPPQSTRTSPPVRVPSWHDSSVHDPVDGGQKSPSWQSLSRVHVWPAAQRLAQLPPQSSADSSWF
jgi:hypothetical protein